MAHRPGHEEETKDGRRKTAKELQAQADYAARLAREAGQGRPMPVPEGVMDQAQSASEQASPEKAFEATIARARDTSTPYFGTSLINSSDSDMYKRAGAGDLFAMKHLADRERQSALARANADMAPMGAAGAGMRQAYQDQAEKSFMDLMGLGEKKFMSDTDRAKAGIAEYEQKVTMPERNQAEMEREALRGSNLLEQERMRNEADIAKANLSRKMSLESPFISEIARLAGSGTVPEGALSALTTQMRLVSDLAKTAPDAKPAPKDGGDTEGVPGKTKATELAEAINAKEKETRALKVKKQAEDVLFEKALGLRQDPKTGLYAGGTFDPARIASSLADTNATPEQLAALATKFREANLGPQEKIMSELFRKYGELSMAAGESGGVPGGFKISRGPFGSGGVAPRVFSDEAIGSMTLGGDNPLMDMYRSIPRLTGQGRSRAGSEAKAVDAFIRQVLRQGREQDAKKPGGK